MVDGGVTDNFPMHVLREQGCNPVKILGFKLCSHDEPHYNNNNEYDHGVSANIKSYSLGLIDILRQQALKVHVHKEDWKLTCKIKVGKYSSTDFNISDDGKKFLFEAGKQAIDDHLLEIEQLLDKGEYPL
jgi:predicted acylesterase/phospholipase RssA